MTAVGADLQSTNNELVAIIEELKERRNELDRLIQREEEEKSKIINEMKMLSDRLARVEDSLQHKLHTRAEFDSTIEATSMQFAKILDSSRLLLQSVKSESVLSLTKQSK
jgi:Sjoegren syndrome nuclear autoantigen 1